MGKGKNISELSMLELLQTEVEAQSAVLTNELLELERNPSNQSVIESLMRASHSLKGAARLVDVRSIERIAHALEDVFVAAQHGDLPVNHDAIDACLRAVDLIQKVAARGEKGLTTQLEATVAAVIKNLEAVRQGVVPIPNAAVSFEVAVAPELKENVSGEELDRVVRVSAERLNRLLGLTSDLVVDARNAQSHGQMLLHMKRRLNELQQSLDLIRERFIEDDVNERTKVHLVNARKRSSELQSQLTAYMSDTDEFERRLNSNAARMHREVILTRMRPFADGVRGFQRMVRDLARTTGKKVELEISGLRTDVDRDVMDKLEAPLTHLIRNAVDHAIEAPEERVRAGKPEYGTVRLRASYSGGMLFIVVEDDGNGIDFARLKQKIIERRLATDELAERLSEDELIEFLYLPKFSTRDVVTELSGRGVGLDVVRDAVQEMGGVIRTSTVTGQGTKFMLQLPITLSLIPALLVDIAQESYAFPLPRIDRLLYLEREQIQHVEGFQYFDIDGENVGLVYARGLFGRTPQSDHRQRLAVVVVSDRLSRYGLVVDRIEGERVLAVQSLDPRLGKVKDISAAALLENGMPTLIIDVDDLVRSIDHASRGGMLQQLAPAADIKKNRVEKRVLVVDDSITVRGVETKLLQAHGYWVATAVDGMDGWNRARTEPFDLVITDVDMPRMDGLELVQMIKNDVQLRNLPVMIVSYKDRPEDRKRGLDAGADYYLTKGSFHDETLIEAVVDLIGKVESE